MPDSTLEQIESIPSAARTAVQWMDASVAAESEAEFLGAALPQLRDELDARNVALVRGEKGRWQSLGVTGPQRSLPTDLLSMALDEERAIERQPWSVSPLDVRAAPGELLLIEGRQATSAEVLPTLEAMAGALAVALISIRDRVKRKRRIQRLETILEIAGQWNQTLEMGTLLTQMAEAATRLLRAERASIFLWDRANKTLVGRPALGVDGGELRIPEDTGIVGKVVQSGEPRRVDADVDAEQKQIDRKVDRQLGFQTRSLLCVPLRGKSGQLFGAFEMVNKIDGNFTDEDEAALTELAAHAAIALENTQQREHLLTSRNRIADQAAERVRMIGECPAIEALRSTIRRVADTDLAILLLGENGTGKEVVSQLIHYLSRRRNEPFVAVNCAALTETLLESELFGHEKGAFTDAHEARAGKFELASGGTLFLDEIGDMSPGGQAKLLRVLEEKVVVRVGGSRPIHTDARVIAATNQKLADMVRQKKFREDLYFRLNVVTLDLPPLRERGDDVLLLAEHFLNEFCVKARRKPPRFTAAARKRLREHAWPGNIRELRNLMERIAYLSQEDKVDVDELLFILSPTDQSPAAMPMNLTLAGATKRFQSQYIQKQIEQTRGNMTDAAKRLGLHRSNLYRKMRQLGMETSDEDATAE